MKKKRLNVIVGNNQTRINVLINCIFEKKRDFLNILKSQSNFLEKLLGVIKTFYFF